MDLNVKLAIPSNSVVPTNVDSPQDLSTVATFAASYAAPALDVLICNAGIMNTPFALSKASCAQSMQKMLARLALI